MLFPPNSDFQIPVLSSPFFAFRSQHAGISAFDLANPPENRIFAAYSVLAQPRFIARIASI